MSQSTPTPTPSPTPAPSPAPASDLTPYPTPAPKIVRSGWLGLSGQRVNHTAKDGAVYGFYVRESELGTVTVESVVLRPAKPKDELVP